MAKSLYRNAVTLKFEKQFTRGTLAGITINESLQFLSRKRALEWLRGVRANHKRSELDYKIVSSSFAPPNMAYWQSK